MLVRIVNMRGVNLELFDFDYDLTWSGFFLNADQQVYGRFGGREGSNADTFLTLAGLKYAMQNALESHRSQRLLAANSSKSTRFVESFPASEKLKKNECIHCHQVYDFGRDQLRKEGSWKLEMVWTYPPPKNLGLILDPDQGNRLLNVASNSAASQTGLRAGDVLETVDQRPVASFADVQFALHYAPPDGKIPLTWTRGGHRMQGELEVTAEWRKSDISWRGSMWGLEPTAAVYGDDLKPEEKEALGLTPKRLAFRQGDFVPHPSRDAGVRARDIIIGFDNQEMDMTMLQFVVHIRLSCKVGDRVTINLIRDGKRIDLPMVLQAKDF